MRSLTVLALVLLTSCGSGPHQATPGEAQARSDSWWAWHDRKREVDRAVSEAVNEPGGGDYAKAVAAIRGSDRPDDVKSHQIGMLIINGFGSPGATRPREPLEQGLRMVEDATIMGGEMERNGPPQLRRVFERGAGAPPNAIPVTPEIATCWLAVERGQNEDRARCIELRRQRLPHVGQ